MKAKIKAEYEYRGGNPVVSVVLSWPLDQVVLYELPVTREDVDEIGIETLCDQALMEVGERLSDLLWEGPR